MTKSFKYLGLAAVLLLTACGGGEEENASLVSLKDQRDSLKAVKAEISVGISELESKIALLDTNLDRRVTAVTVIASKQGTFEHFFTVQGNVETDMEAMVYPEAQGRILKIAAKEGQKVSKGQVLMVLDSRVLQNSIDELKSRLELAETIFQKQDRLWKKNIGSEIQYLEAKNNRDALRKNLETMNSQLDMYNVKAPFDGVVDDIMPKMGEMASPMAPVARVLNLDQVYLKCDVTESYLGQIKEGDSVKVKFPSLGLNYSTTISRIGKYINPANRTFTVTVKINNKNERLSPNLIGEVSIRDFVQDSAIMIPRSIVLQNPKGEEFVYVSKTEGETTSVERRMISTGIISGDMQLIKSGLKANEQVVSEGSRSVKDGQEVKILKNLSYGG